VFWVSPFFLGIPVLGIPLGIPLMGIPKRWFFRVQKMMAERCYGYSFRRREIRNKNPAIKRALLSKFDKLSKYGNLNRAEKENHPARWLEVQQ
jgi:hypothetical protein